VLAIRSVDAGWFERRAGAGALVAFRTFRHPPFQQQEGQTKMVPNDTGVVAVFRNGTVPNRVKSAEAGRPIFDDVEVVEIRYPGSRDYGVYPATERSHWDVDQFTGEQRQVTFAERFSKQYQQFKASQQQTKSGTPLDYLTFLTEGKRAELRALNIYTAEALAIVDGSELKKPASVTS
jgi:hypothetical protein